METTDDPNAILIRREKRRRERSNRQIVQRKSRINSKANMIIKQRRSSLFNSKMLKVVTSVLLAVACIVSIWSDVAEGSMSLPDGIENILGFVPRSTFRCERDGYFGDIDNDCRIFHLCQKQVHANGRTEWRHWTYACGNQTMFNQLTLTCAFVDEAIPCKHASQFQYLNEVIHKPREPFLTDADVTSGISYYSNRVMSDGARARAFEDSRLMAQLGGGSAKLAAQVHNQQPKHSFETSNNNFVDAPIEHVSIRRDAAESTFGLENFIDQGAIQSEQNTFLQNFPTNQQQQWTGDALPQQQQQVEKRAPVELSLVQLPPQVPFSSMTIPTHQVDIRNSAAPLQQHQQSQQQLPTQQQQPQQQQQLPNSFEFSIATNHQQQGASAPTSVFTSNLPLPQYAAVPQAADPAQIQVATEQASRFAVPTTLPPPPALPAVKQHQQQPESTTQRHHQASVTTTTSAPTSPAPQATTSANNQRPSQVTSASSATAVTTTQRSQQQQVRRKLKSRPASQQRVQAQHTRQQREHLLDHQLNGLFQSTRLSSAAQSSPDKSKTTRQQQAPLVMRPSETRRAGSEASPSENSIVAASAVPLTGVMSNNFWRQPFESITMANRFDSLLTRRRV